MSSRTKRSASAARSRSARRVLLAQLRADDLPDHGQLDRDPDRPRLGPARVAERRQPPDEVAVGVGERGRPLRLADVLAEEVERDREAVVEEGPEGGERGVERLAGDEPAGQGEGERHVAAGGRPKLRSHAGRDPTGRPDQAAPTAPPRRGTVSCGEAPAAPRSAPTPRPPAGPLRTAPARCPSPPPPPAPARRPPWADRWVDPDRRPADRQGRRHARAVVSGGALALGASLLLVLALGLGGAPPATPVALAAAAAALSAGSVAAVRWGGHVRPAAWALTLTVAATPVLQARQRRRAPRPDPRARRAGPARRGDDVRGPAGGRRPPPSARPGRSRCGRPRPGAGRPPPSSPPDVLRAYSLAAVTGGSLISALAGALYVHHTRRALGRAEGQSTRLDAALRDSEARFRSLFNGVPVGMYRTTPDGRVMLANRRARADARGRGPRPRRRPRRDGPLRRPGRPGPVPRADRPGRAPSAGSRPGGAGPRAASATSGSTPGPSATRAGGPLHYEGVVEDVTAEREAREALFRSEARFRALVQRSSDVVVVVGPDGAVRYVSPAVERLLDRRPESVLGRPALDTVHPDDRDNRGPAPPCGPRPAAPLPPRGRGPAPPRRRPPTSTSRGSGRRSTTTRPWAGSSSTSATRPSGGGPGPRSSRPSGRPRRWPS